MIDNKIKFFDATLRDGSHAIKHQLTKQNIIDYCDSIDGCGIDSVIVGHGNGLGASSLQVGMSLLTDKEMLEAAKEHLKKTKLGTYMIPGFGTIKDDLEPAIALGVNLFKIGCHCTEANTTKQHIEYLAKRDKEVYGILMMYHYAETDVLVEQAKMMESYGVKGVILMDSAGASTPILVRDTITKLKQNLYCDIGFHAHNNLGLAVGNTMIAIECGANIVDATVRGFGAGSGNCQMECVVAALIKSQYNISVDLDKLIETSDEIVSKFSNISQGQEGNNIRNGMSGIFSAFKFHIINASKNFNVSIKDIYSELSKRKPVAGQEDIVIEVAEMLSRNKNRGL